MELAPIVLFVYNRPWHTEKTLEALSKNELANRSKLYVYCDGPKEGATESDKKKIKEVRHIIRKQQWCKEVLVVERNTNLGLANSIIKGVTEIVNKYGKIIVLEDDIVTSIGFLQYMNDALNLYETDSNVYSISAFIYDNPRIARQEFGKTFFYNVNSCWGWATWSRAWDKFDANASSLKEKIDKNYSKLSFNGGQEEAFYSQLVMNHEGTLKTWAILWHASMYINNGAVLHPYKTLIKNIGFDNSGENCGEENEWVNKSNLNLISNLKIERQNSKKHQEQSLLVSKSIVKYKRRQRKSKLVMNKLRNTLSNIKTSIYYTKEEQEKIRLGKIPRYTPAETTLFNSKIRMVDTCTYLGGVQEVIEKDIYRFNTKKTTPIIIDCGANIGLSVIYFKKLYSDAIIEAFEPDPKIFQVLSWNIASFGFNNVILNEAAIWNENTVIEFQQEGGFSGRIPKKGDSANIIGVKAKRLKDVINKYSNIDFLKIDIEGAEYEVLLDIQDDLGKVDNIFIEYHSHVSDPQTLHEILEILQKKGYRYHIQDAFVREKPYVDKNTLLGMDLQLNIFGFRDGE